MALTCGCAAKTRQTAAPERAPILSAQPGVNEVQHASWRAIRFSVNWPEQSEPRWEVDLLLAKEVLEPLLNRYRNKIPLWRFHRRAAPDPTGHQFSLLVFADSETVASIYSELLQDAVVRSAIDKRLLMSVRLDLPIGSQPTAIEGASDAGWPVEIRKAWPFFAMGVSQSWLALLSSAVKESAVQGTAVQETKAAAANTEKDDNLARMLIRYKKANELVSLLWRDAGGHAYLHHLSALFGYQPVIFKSEGRF